MYCRFFVWHMRASICQKRQTNIDACHLVEESNSYPQNNIIHDKSYMINHNKVSNRMHPSVEMILILKNHPHTIQHIIENS